MPEDGAARALLVKPIKEAAEDESKATYDYRKLAELAEGLGFYWMGQELRAIGRQEFEHWNKLQAMVTVLTK